MALSSMRERGLARSGTLLSSVLVALALGATSCGDSADENDTSTAGTTTPAPAADVPRAGNERPRDDGASGGPSLLGDRVQARAGATAVSNAYEDLRAAATAGVPANDASVYDTIDAAEQSDGLGRVCDLMSERAKRQAIVYADRSAGRAGIKWTCRKATGLLLRRAGQAGGLEKSMRAQVIGVNAQGNRATATVRFGGPKGRLSTIPLVKEDGQWKLGTAPDQGAR